LKIIIVGAGEVGFHIAGRLALENKEVVVVDTNVESIRRVAENSDVQTVIGSGSNPSILEEAGIQQAEILLAVTDRDETNLVACMVANILSPSTKKLARIRGADFDRFHDTFREKAPHIDTIINPEIEVVKTIESLMRVPGAVDVGQFADGQIKFVGIRLDPNSSLAGAKLSELPERIGDRRPLIAAVVRNEELIIPTGKDRLLGGDLIYFISEDKDLLDNLSAFGKHAKPVKRVLIIGGGRIGLRLARSLENQSVYIKLIEKNAQRCAFLAERLNKTVVLHGDGSDQGLLSEENVADMDAVVTLTNDEETNILASLLAKRMGAGKSITKINKFSYFPLMSTIGIDQVVSPRLSAINTILQHIRRGKVLSAISLKGEQAEAMEAVALETSDIVGKPLKRISFPKGAIVAGIIRRNIVIIPSGESVIEPNDRVIIFAHRRAISAIEKMLAVKLEFF
jgi:trk system potassium uptake protein TrkA